MKKYKCKRLSRPQAICQVEKHGNGLLITGFEEYSLFVEMSDDEPTSDEACCSVKMVLHELMDALWFFNFKADIRVHSKHNEYSSDTEFDLKWDKEEKDRVAKENYDKGYADGIKKSKP